MSPVPTKENYQKTCFLRSSNFDVLRQTNAKWFLLFVIIGASISLGAVIDFSDAMIFAMVVPNMIGVVLLSPKIKEELTKYMNAIKSNKK